MSGWLWGGRGSVVRTQQLKPGALGSIPGGCPDVFSSSKLSDVDGVVSSMQCSTAAITTEIWMSMPVGS